MNDTIKEKEFYETQKYIATQEWIDIRDSINARITELSAYILEDAILPQPLTKSRNMMRWLWNELASKYIELINNKHLKWMLQMFLINDNNERLLMPTEKSCDIIEYSDKDWCRRERRILRYIADFDKIYWQDKDWDDNEDVEDWMNSLSEGILL